MRTDDPCVCGHARSVHSGVYVAGDCHVVDCLCPGFVTRADLEAPDPTPRHVRLRRVRAWFRARTSDGRARTEDV